MAYALAESEKSGKIFTTLAIKWPKMWGNKGFGG